MANSDLIGKMWKIPNPYLAKLRKKLNNHQGDKHVEGYTRLQNLLQSGKISYENLKNVKHILDKNIKNETIYELNGGKDFHRWINDQLSVARNSIESGKKIQKDVGNQNAYKKPHEKDSTNKGKVRTARLDKSSSSEDIYNNNVNYESFKNVKILVTESQYHQLFKEEINIANKKFLGYHSSEREMVDGLYKASVLDEEHYSDLIRSAYMDIISDYDNNLENDNIKKMNAIFRKNKYGFTFVSDEPIKASAYQASEYKYGDYLYEVFGDGSEILLDDHNEIGATIVVSKKPLYFKQVKTNEDTD